MQAEYPEVVNSEKAKSEAPAVSGEPEGNCGVRQQREHDVGTAESKTPGMHGNFTRENRETQLPSAAARRRIGGRRR